MLLPAGQYDAGTLTGLDFVLNEASKRNIRVLLVFANYWSQYGGVDQYNVWSFQAGTGACPACLQGPMMPKTASCRSLQPLQHLCMCKLHQAQGCESADSCWAFCATWAAADLRTCRHLQR